MTIQRLVEVILQNTKEQRTTGKDLRIFKMNFLLPSPVSRLPSHVSRLTSHVSRLLINLHRPRSLECL
jgi:hypothetical protein